MAPPADGSAFAPPPLLLGRPPTAAPGWRLCRWHGGDGWRRAAAAATTRVASAAPVLRPAAAPRATAAAAGTSSPPGGSGTSPAAPGPPPRTAASAGATVTVVVPGKFDAFHAGHLALVRAAAATARGVRGRGDGGDDGHGGGGGRGDGGAAAAAPPIAITLVTFSGMAAALRWPPRATVVAPADIPPILRDWGRAVGAPVSLRILPFEAVRQLSPAAFLDFLVASPAGGGDATTNGGEQPRAATSGDGSGGDGADGGGGGGGSGGGGGGGAVAAVPSPVAGLAGLGASAVVCGEDWRFGHRAAAGVEELRALAPARGLAVTVVGKVPVGGAAVSSTRVRSALDAGEVWLAGQLMGRPHRLWGQVLGSVDGEDDAAAAASGGGVMTGEFINQVPAAGAYAVVVRVRGRAAPLHTLAQVRPGGLRVDLEAVEGELPCTECEVSIDFVERVGGA